MKDLTPDGLARIEELARRASTPPWEAAGPTSAEVRGVGHTVARAVSKSDSGFIASARAAVPALVAAVRSRDERIAELEAERDQLRSWLDNAEAEKVRLLQGKQELRLALHASPRAGADQ